MNFYALPDDRFAEFAQKCGAELLPAESSAADMVDAVVVQTGCYTSNNYRIEGMHSDRFLSFDLDKMTDLSKGDVFKAQLHGGEAQQPEFNTHIAGFTSGRYYLAPEYLTIIISKTDMLKLSALKGDEYPSFIYECTVKLNGTDSALKARLDEILNTNEGSLFDALDGSLEIIKNTNVTSLADAIVSIANTMLVCFVILVSIICMLNLANSIRSRLLARRHELATLKSIGMTDSQMKKTLLSEALCCTAASLIAAALCAGLIIWGLYGAISGIVGKCAFVFPWLAVLLAVVIGSAAICGFTLLFASHNKKENLIEEIRRSVV